MHRLLLLIKQFFIIVCVAVFFSTVQLIILLTNIHHQVEILNTETNNKIIIKNLTSSFSNGIFNLNIKNIQLNDISNTIISNINMIVNFDILLTSIFTKQTKNNKTVFELYIDNFDVYILSKFLNNTFDKKIQVQNSSYNSIFMFLNTSMSLKTFKATIRFKDFVLQNNVSSINIHSISFSNVTSYKNSLGEIKINCDINSKKNIIQGFLLQNSDQNNLTIELYGYLNLLLHNSNSNIKLNDFYRSLLTYNTKLHTISYDIDMKEIYIEHLSDSFIVRNVSIIGEYNVNDRNLNIKEFKFYLSNENDTIPFTGNLSIRNGKFIDANINSNGIFDITIFKEIFSKINLLKENKISINGTINKLNIIIKTDTNFNFNDKNVLQVKFSMSNLVISNENLNYLTFKSKLINFTLNYNKSISISSKDAMLADVIKVQNIDIVLPLNDDKVKSKCNLEIITNINKLQNIANLYNKMLSLNDGIVKINVFQIDLKNLSFIANMNIHNAKALYNNNNYHFNGDNIKINFNKNILNIEGDIQYNDIQIIKANFQSHIDANGIKPLLANFTVNLEQNIIHKFLKDLEINANGNINVMIHDNFSKFSIVLNDADIEYKPLNFHKKRAINSAMHIKLNNTNNKKVHTINATLADITIEGNIIFHEDYSLDKIDATLNKNNKFYIEYLPNNKQYNCNINTLHIDIVQNFLQSIQKQSNILKNIDLTQDKQAIYTVNLNAENISYLKKKLLSQSSINLQYSNNKLLKVEASAYNQSKNGYIKLFFDQPIIVMVINNFGSIIRELFDINSVDRGNMYLYGQIDDIDHILPDFKGEIFMYNFKLLQSQLLSIIFRIYTLSSFNIQTIFNMFSKGIDFSNMYCSLSCNQNSISIAQCRAFSTSMLFSLKGNVDIFPSMNGSIEGLIVPESFWNLPIIFMEKTLNKQNKSLLNANDKHNFSLKWNANLNKPIIKVNPMSFLLPHLLYNFTL